MKITTRICSVESLIPSLAEMLAPRIPSGDNVLFCVENKFSRDEENSYGVLLLTQNRIYSGFQDFPSAPLPEGKLRDSITLQEISSIERRVTHKDRYPQLVINAKSGSVFTVFEFSSDSLIETFIKVLSQVGMSVKLVEST